MILYDSTIEHLKREMGFYDVFASIEILNAYDPFDTLFDGIIPIRSRYNNGTI